MAVQHIQHVRIAGVSAAVPKQIRETRGLPCFENEEECERYIENVGVERTRKHDGSITCSDLCLRAAERLMADLGWVAEDVDLLVFLSQSQDYVLPATACVLHGKMGLKQSCACFDISLGCSGWTYGLSVVGSMMQSGGFKRALLLMGDDPDNPMGKPLFGDAGTATALEFDIGAAEMLIDTRTDGTGYEAIIKREGAKRHPFNEHSLIPVADRHGNIHRPIDTEMDGPAVFVFGITKVPRAVKDILKLANRAVDDVDCFLFHQANLMMNEQIRKKCKIPAEKCPYSIRDFGNNSSASIPITMVTAAREQLNDSEAEIVACAFGVGLSWATLHMKLQRPVISPLVEV
ncbi:MAG: ketoacyl-ACP synthase III [Akkermansia sp.]|nr:ketoacyl-ACP synthase III [Akkermansia sp.]